MATENPMTMLESDSSINWRASASLASPSNATVGNDIFSNFMQGNGIIRETESTAPYRSGSAPPTFEGSIAALRDFMDQQSSSLTSSTSGELDCQSEEQLRSHPTYISYYYANVNLNPRLPPPLISRENQHLVRHIVGWGTGRRLPTLDQGFLYSHREEFEEDILAKQALDVQSRDSSTYMTGQKNVSSADHSGSPVQMQEGCPAPSICETTANDGNDKDDKAISVTGHSLVSDSCSASLSNADAPAPLPDDRNTDFDRDTSTQGTTALNTSKIELKLKALNVSGALETGHNQMRQSKLPGLPQQDIVNQVPGVQVQAISQGMNNSHDGMEKFSGFHPKFVGMHPYMHNPGLIPPLYATTAAVMASGNPVHPNAHPSSLYNAQLTLGGFGVGWHPTYPSGYPSHNGLSVPIEGYSGLGVIKHDLGVPAGESNPYVAHVQYLNKIYGQRGLMLHPSLGSPIQGQHFPHTFEEAYRVAAVQHSPPSERDGIQGKTNANVSETEPDATAFVGDKKLGYLANQSSNISFPGRSGRASVNYYVRPPGCSITQVPAPFTLMQGSPVVGINHSETVDQPSFSQASPRSTRMYSGLKGHRGSESSDDFKGHSFVELLKSSSARKLELSDIVGQIVQFSTDQHGSRFIQQKLEHCSAAEKESVFNEVLPHASKLTTDVFGNYVIQKFFEYGSPEQRRKLADQHAGQILTLSLQMYGCRVIQKALEVVELDQKIKLVQELDGHVMRCVHDQNGNHVIQKCIESVPAEKTGFIICAFHGQVSTLSSHPYGCRVIQRVLEHYSDQVTSQSVVAEILESACALAYDPYGNYVTQHVLEMGKPKERSKLMSKFSGGFVQMSQHKYASNVVEKCLKYSNTKERDLLIEEIIEQPETDDLLAMMKDQYANYVIQKILEICSDKQRERLFNCIRDDVQALKKYTYAKHIIARYEQLSEDKSEDMPATVREG